MAVVFRSIDDVESSSVVFSVALCCKGVDDFVPWGMNGNGHNVRGEGVIIELSEHFLEFPNVHRWRLQVNDFLALPEIDGEYDAVS